MEELSREDLERDPDRYRLMVFVSDDEIYTLIDRDGKLHKYLLSDLLEQVVGIRLGLKVIPEGAVFTSDGRIVHPQKKEDGVFPWFDSFYSEE